MPTLDLNRKYHLSERRMAVTVICAPREGVSNGWLAAIAPNPGDPLGFWTRRFLDAEPALNDDRPVNVFSDIAPGYYEAHSTYRSQSALSVYFRVTAGGLIRVLGYDGDEDLIIARLNRMTIEELHEARLDAGVEDEQPRLMGSIKQVNWAMKIRETMIAMAGWAGDPDLAARLGEVQDATWFIANRDRSTSELREGIHASP